MNNRLAIGYAKVLREYVKEFDSYRHVSNKFDITTYSFMDNDIRVYLDVDCTRYSILMYDDCANINPVDNFDDLRFVLENMYKLKRA